MKKEQYIKLLTKYLEGGATAEEENFLFAYYNLFIADADVMDLLSEEEKLKLKLNIKAGIDDQLGWASLIKKETQEEDIITKKHTLWPKIAAAAAILLIIGAGLFYYSSRHVTLNSLQGPGLAGQDIKPGGNKAYLTLANGKRLSLTDAANGTVAKEAGVEITKTADGQVIYSTRNINYSNALNTIETPRGGQYQVRLPDGSKVWLNAASKLIYPVSFKGRERREIELSGEAYFEIFKNKLQPFVVKSKNQEVTVLGTHFNINSYSDENSVKTTLLEGSVKVNDAILKPNEQAILKNNKINIQPVNAQSEIAWKNGYFNFKDEGIENIMRILTRWYDIEVSYQGNITTDGFTGQFSRYNNISQVLKVLEHTKLVHFKIEGRRVMVTD